MMNRCLLSCLQHGIKMHRFYSSAVIEDVAKVGNRDIVGFGFNGIPSYIDRTDFPMPAVRFKENTADILALREKEKGDWKKLSIEEKKQLYRASFCSTFAELDAPTGEWKSVAGFVLMFLSLSLWVFYFYKAFVLPPLPESFNEENQLAQLERIKKLQMNPITGITAKK